MDLPSPQPKFKVLILEDSKIVSQKLMQLLGNLPELEIIGVAHNTLFAMQMVSLHKPDAVLIDIHLEGDAPNANGITFLSQLKDSFPSVFAVMYTNLVEEVYRIKCFESGASYFLDKSDDFDKLVEVMKSLAAKKLS